MAEGHETYGNDDPFVERMFHISCSDVREAVSVRCNFYTYRQIQLLSDPEKQSYYIIAFARKIALLATFIIRWLSKKIDFLK